MEIKTSETKVLGIVLDLSLRHADDGRRMVDHVKKAICNYLRQNCHDGDILYFYDPNVVESVSSVGEQVSVVGNFEPTRQPIDNFALKQAWYVLVQEDYHLPKKMIYITDRLIRFDSVRSLSMLNKDNFCDISVLCIGDAPPFPDLPVAFQKITSPVDLPDALQKLLWKTQS